MSDPAAIRKHTVLVAGHHTSLSVEDVFWTELKAIAKDQGLSINALVTEIDAARSGNLSSAVRVFVLQNLKSRLT